MRTSRGRSLLLVMSLLIACADSASAQQADMRMTMSTKTLLIAQLDAKQVAGASASSATGTGAFLLDAVQHTLEFRVTYQGLDAGGAKSIGLYNFGKGKNGERVKELCGVVTQPCPDSASATISGRFERGDDRALDNHLIGEFDSERIYVEIVGTNGKPEIRGQLAPNTAMVPVANYVAYLAPIAGSNSKASGTAIFSETYLPGGKVSVSYAVTVAETSGAPTGAALATNPAPKARRMALPKLKLRFSRDKETGGSLTGLYEVNSAAPDAVLVTRHPTSVQSEAGLVVTTSRFPNGELYGVLMPVR